MQCEGYADLDTRCSSDASWRIVSTCTHEEIHGGDTPVLVYHDCDMHTRNFTELAMRDRDTVVLFPYPLDR